MSTIRTGPIPRSETYVQTRLITASSPQLPDNIKTRKEINLEIIYSCLDNGGHYTDLDELVLAYAVTIHKAQGSEYPIVIMALTMQHYVMLQKNLLYTGVTRAKEIVVIIGTEKAIACAVKNNQVVKRNTGLKVRLNHPDLGGAE